MKRKIIVIASVLVLIALIAVRLIGNKQKIEENNQVIDRSAIEIPVTTTRAEMQIGNSGFSLPAETEAASEVELSLKTAGILQSLTIETGSRVRQGQQIGGLDVSLLKLNLESARLLVKKSERDYLNLKDLYAQNAASENEFRNAEYTYNNAKVQEAQISQQIADGSLISPVNGVVVSKTAEKGEFVSAGKPVATIVDVSHLKVVIMASEYEAYALKEGMKVRVSADIYPDHTFSGTISYVSPKGNQNHNYPVEVQIDNEKQYPLKAGTFVRVHFEFSDARQVLTIPKTALVEGLKNPYVYTIQNGKAQVRKLVLGQDMGDYVEVRSGLRDKEEIIISGQINLSEGSLVEIVGNNTQEK